MAGGVGMREGARAVLSESSESESEEGGFEEVAS